MRDLKIFTDNIEQEAIDQINTLLEQPAFADCKVRIMPDVHAGAGCVIGFTADLGDKVIPNIVGVDIGCGMLTVELGCIDIDYDKLDATIRALIPSGRNVHDDFDLVPAIEKAKELIDELHCKEDLRNISWLERSMGTLGGGNHFIEIDEGSDGSKYLVIHTGSRNLGKQVAEYYQRLAVKRLYANKEERADIIAKCKAEGRERDIQAELAKLASKHSSNVPKDLCYLEGKDHDDYLDDMKICQHFAKLNREFIAYRIIGGMNWPYPLFGGMNWPYPYNIDRLVEDPFHTIHNYIELETNMVRKGAISAKKGEKVLIPINMRDGSLLCVGKGNEDWNCSAPHGAGRIMSRNKARESISMESFRESMNGVYTTSVCESTIDESPMAYKPINEIINNIKDTVDILDVLKPVYNFKASED